MMKKMAGAAALGLVVLSLAGCGSKQSSKVSSHSSSKVSSSSVSKVTKKAKATKRTVSEVDANGEIKPVVIAQKAFATVRGIAADRKQADVKPEALKQSFANIDTKPQNRQGLHDLKFEWRKNDNVAVSTAFTNITTGKLQEVLFTARIALNHLDAQKGLALAKVVTGDTAEADYIDQAIEVANGTPKEYYLRLKAGNGDKQIESLDYKGSSFRNVFSLDVEYGNRLLFQWADPTAVPDTTYDLENAPAKGTNWSLSKAVAKMGIPKRIEIGRQAEQEVTVVTWAGNKSDYRLALRNGKWQPIATYDYDKDPLIDKLDDFFNPA